MATFDRCSSVVMPQRERVRLAMLVVALMSLSAACSDADSAAPPTTTRSDRSATTTVASATHSTTITAANPTTSSPSATAGQSVEGEIIARYVGYWKARVAANSGTPNPDDPGLREFATGEQLDAVINETQANLDQGLAFRPATNPSGLQRVEVIQVEGDRAVVQECVVADGVIVRRESGEIVNDEVATHNVRGELIRVDGAWKVSSARLVQRWEGVAGCALGS